MILRHLFACPKCKLTLQIIKNTATCFKCKRIFQKQHEVWNFLIGKDVQTRHSIYDYEIVHQSPLHGPDDGSYEVLAAFAKGNRTLDVACGDGIIEKLAPQTVGLEFSRNALLKAKKNGAKYLVQANAEALPFANNSFDVCICAGSLEHFINPQQALSEMSRVSKIQVLTVHSMFNVPGITVLFKIVSKLLRIQHQPIEKPISENKLRNMLEKANAHIVFKGVWTLPFNYGRVIPWLPELEKFPSVRFVISIKK